MNSLMAMVGFEWKRLITPGRSFWWLVVAAFPAAIIFLMQNLGQFADVTTWQRNLERMQAREVTAEEAQEHIDLLLTLALYFLAPSISCILGCLLTAAPSVASELEQHSWTYLATRPNGLFHLVIGKYLVAFFWSASATVAGLSLGLFFAQMNTKADAAWALIGVSLLSAMSYSALFLMIGTVFHQRSMVFCVAYTAAVELFLGFFPAVINRFTIQYRLRSLLHEWTTTSKDSFTIDVTKFVDATEGPMLQVLWLVSLTVVFLAVALTSVQVREFTVAAETDV